MGVLLSVRAEAKVCGRLEMVEVVCDDAAAGSESGGGCKPENGFLGGCEFEKGLVVVALDVVDENGFEDVELVIGFTPNKLLPIFVTAVRFDCDSDAADFELASSLCFCLLSIGEADILTPRSALTLPSLRLHVFRRQVST